MRGRQLCGRDCVKQWVSTPRCTLELPWEKPELFLKMIQRCSDPTPKTFRFHWSGVRTRHRILKFSFVLCDLLTINYVPCYWKVSLICNNL